MSQATNISDDPLPPADPVSPLEHAQVPEPPAHDVVPKPDLEAPHLSPVGSYGHTDPASLAAVQSHELADPSLNAAENTELEAPTLTTFTPGEGVASSPAEAEIQSKTPVVSADFSNWDPHLAHLAQVGLTSADQWEEQIKPRIDQLHEDIDEVNLQLDDLEKAKPKPKSKKS